MRQFPYLRDPLFLLGCAAYAINRGIIKRFVHTGFFHNHFNDCWLIPCALPPVLWLHQRLGLRPRDAVPQLSEIVAHLIFWSLLFEWIGPKFVRGTTGDPLDVLAYCAGAVVAALWWQRERWFNLRPSHEVLTPLAPYYRWMELVLAGQKMHRCRTAFLSQIPRAQNILLLGEGHGRALIECRRQFARSSITCVDASQGMLEQARRRLARNHLAPDRTDFVHADALAWQPPANAYDLIVTQFFFDCFRADQLEALVGGLAAGLTKDANWLVADFQIPAQGLKRIRSRLIVWSLYLFFRVMTRLPARFLTQPDAFLKGAGFKLVQRVESEWGLLRSDCWRRNG